MLILSFATIFFGPVLGMICSFLSILEHFKQSRILCYLKFTSPILTLIGVSNTVYNISVKSIKIRVIMPYIFNKIQYIFATDRYGILFMCLVACVYPIAVFYTEGYFKYQNDKRLNSTMFFIHMAVFCCLALAIASNLFTAFVFYELITLSTYPLIISSDSSGARLAGRYYLSYLLSTSVLLLLPFTVLVYNLSGTLAFTPGGILRGINLSVTQVNLLFLAMFFGVAKTAIMPIGKWLLKAMIAPAPISAIIHAVVVVKSGVFLVARCIDGIFGIDLLDAYIWKIGGMNILSIISISTIILSSIRAILTHDLKERLAYSTIGQLSYSLLTFSMFSSLGMKAGMMQLIAHSLAKMTLFFGAGCVFMMNKSYKIANITTMWRKAPIVSTSIILGCLSILGLPPTVGFYSKYGIMSAILGDHGYVLITLVLFATLLSTYYIFDILYHVLFVPKDLDDSGVQERLPTLVSVSLFTLCILIVFAPHFIDKLLYTLID